MKFYLYFVSLTLILGFTTSGCGVGVTSTNGNSAESEATKVVTPETVPADLAKELYIFNWADFIDEPLLKTYEQKYGVEIIYDTYASGEDLLAKLQAGATGYDVVFVDDNLVTTFAELGLLAPIDHTNIPNLKNIDPKFLDTPRDPGTKYCAPYLWGTSGIAYRKDVFGDHPPDSWAFLFDPEMARKWSEAGGINLLNDQREVIGAALKYLGYSLNDTNEAHLQEAKEVILKVKPYIKSFNSEDYDETLLVPGEVVISHAWNGDVAQAASKTIDEATGESPWAYVVPKEGGFIYQTGICVAAASQNKATAEHFINYLLEAHNAAANTNYTYYASSNAAAREFILPEILEDPTLYPSQEIMDQLEWGAPLGEAIFLYDRIWTEIKSQ